MYENKNLNDPNIKRELLGKFSGSGNFYSNFNSIISLSGRNFSGIATSPNKSLQILNRMEFQVNPNHSFVADLSLSECRYSIFMESEQALQKYLTKFKIMAQGNHFTMDKINYSLARRSGHWEG